MDMRSISEDAPEVPMAGAYARQGRRRAAPAGAITWQPSGWDGQVGQDRPGRANPWRGHRDRHPTSAGSGRMGLRCAMTMGKRRALLRSALAVSPAVLAHG